MYKIFALLFILLLAGACSRGEKPDVRNMKWGMSKDEVRGIETAELINDSDEVITYRLGGVTKLEIDTGSKGEQAKEGAETDEESTPPEVESINYEYDLLYVFTDGKLSMITIHLRDNLDIPEDYLELFRQSSKTVSKQTGATANGLASYPSEEEQKPDPYADPGAICRGEHSLTHFWPAVNKRTNISLELDQKKFSQEPECNLSIFYESVDFPVDPELSDQLHDLL